MMIPVVSGERVVAMQREKMSRPCVAPVLVGALGGSGTRVVAKLLRYAGVFMGSDLNEAEDSEPVMRFYEVWLRRYLECDGNLPPAERESAREMLEQALVLHLAGLNDENGPWGVKVPRNILMLPFWQQVFPVLSFVHVIRDGLDMAYSKDRNQLRMVGDLVLTSEESSLPEPLRAIAYWQRVNLMVSAYGEDQLGPRYLRLRFEDLCADPKWAYERLRRFLELRNGPVLPVAIENEVVSPASIGRWREHSEREIERLLDIGGVGLRRFGYSDRI
jgi:hypothetical protein